MKTYRLTLIFSLAIFIISGCKKDSVVAAPVSPTPVISEPYVPSEDVEPPTDTNTDPFDETDIDQGGNAGPYEPPMTPEQKKWRRQYAKILTDRDTFSLSGGSIDSVKLRLLDCYASTDCASFIFQRSDLLDTTYFYLDDTDQVFLQNGVLRFVNGDPDLSNAQEYILEPLSLDDVVPALELIPIPYPSNAKFYYSKIISMDLEARKITMKIWLSNNNLGWILYPVDALGVTLELYEE